MSGIIEIWQGDVLRRTYGKFADFSAAVNESLYVSPLTVVLHYFNFKTDLTYGLPNVLFPIVAILSAVVLIKEIKHNKNFDIRIPVLWFLSFLATLSWLVLAKNHSYVHTHMNYVLWYFGFIQISLYTLIDMFRDKNG